MNRKLKDYLVLLGKGMGMGAADVIPGVSGGTIAFITGIYEELIHSIKSINLAALNFLLKGKLRDLWKHINGNFLLAVFGGIFISVLSLAKVIDYLLKEHPILIWAFFFGLILASTLVVARKISKWDYSILLAVIIGTGAAFYITSVAPSETTNAAWFVFFAGALAICAMILPGISGSFILLLLGKYQFALNAVNEFQILPLILLGSGAVIGLISFSNLLSWLLKKYHDITVAVLAGFMLGSLNKIWPWKEVIESVMINGEMKVLMEKNIVPSAGNPDHHFWLALLLCLAGLALVLTIELGFGKRKAKK